MSNLTSASGEPSVSSGNRTETAATNYSQYHHHAPPPPAETQPSKKKRNLPGNPDPEAEVVALSPKTLMATNRFVCEICNKGFQRDQNLQLHRRGHNLPWKLKQRTSKEVRKKVYVCPETTCVHHDPARALGDLTGIKKHFSRKHGEKKWKCDKCSKKYAVQSDWKAHSKTCGTREYRCDCGTLFSRRDSFITHRAFCDALAEESSRALTANPILLPTQPGTSASQINQLQPQFSTQDLDLHAFSLKKEQQNFNNLRPELPPWLAHPPQPIDISSSIFSTRLDQALHENQNPNPNPSLGPTLPPYQPTPASPHMSATALLQKAAQMGATMSKNDSSPAALIRPHLQQPHVSVDNSGTSTAGFGLNLASSEEMHASGFVHGALAASSFGNKAAGAPHTTLLQDMMSSLSSASHDFDGTSFEDAFGGILNSKKDTTTHLPRIHEGGGGGGGSGGGGGGEGMTRDFLGLRPLSHSDILNFAGLGNCMNNSQEHPSQSSQKPWQG